MYLNSTLLCLLPHLLHAQEVQGHPRPCQVCLCSRVMFATTNLAARFALILPIDASPTACMYFRRVTVYCVLLFCVTVWVV
jgi:hypothetical protein